MGTNDPRSELLTMLRELAYKRGQFTLASGKESEHYVNSKLVLLESRGAKLFADWMLEQIRALETQPVAIGGLELGAVPIACSVTTLSDDLRTFIIRKKQKAHGAGLAVEGRLQAGDPVVVVDDVITTGGSTWKAIETVEALGCQVVGIYAVVDREDERVPELAGRNITAFATLSELVQGSS